MVAAKFMKLSQAMAQKHYAVHKGKEFYDGLILYITSGPVMAMVWEGPDAIAAVRQTMGATRPIEAATGSLRHDYALEVGRNLTHASDASQTAIDEINLWFNEDEFVDWTRDMDRWVFED
jgi:nucleoside-diphosphate kinase